VDCGEHCFVDELIFDKPAGVPLTSAREQKHKLTVFSIGRGESFL
jgi:hypothetical protein